MPTIINYHLFGRPLGKFLEQSVPCFQLDIEETIGKTDLRVSSQVDSSLSPVGYPGDAIWREVLSPTLWDLHVVSSVISACHAQPVCRWHHLLRAKANICLNQDSKAS